MANDSDADGMLDGWEVRYGSLTQQTRGMLCLMLTEMVSILTPTLSTKDSGEIWMNSNVATTANGYNATDPRVADTDGDGVGDGAELLRSVPRIHAFMVPLHKSV